MGIVSLPPYTHALKDRSTNKSKHAPARTGGGTLVYLGRKRKNLAAQAGMARYTHDREHIQRSN